MSLEAVLERPSNVRDLSPILNDSTRDPRALVTPAMRDSAGKETLLSHMEYAAKAQLYSFLFGDKIDMSVALHQKRDSYDDLSYLAYLKLANNPLFSSKKVAEMRDSFYTSVSIAKYEKTSSSLIRDRFNYEVLFGNAQLPGNIGFGYSEIREDLENLADQLSEKDMITSTMKSGLPARAKVLELLAKSRLLFPDEFDHSKIWQKVRQKLLVNLEVPSRTPMPLEVLTNIMYATILEADRALLDPDQGIRVEFNKVLESPVTPLPTQRRFS